MVSLGVFHRETHEVSRKEALSWSGVWISLAVIATVLTVAIVTSLRVQRREAAGRGHEQQPAHKQEPAISS